MNSFVRKLFSRKSHGDKNTQTDAEMPRNTLASIESDYGHSSEDAISIEYDDSVKHRLAELTFSNDLDIKNFWTFFDELLPEAAKLIVEAQTGSTSVLQRKLKLGYNRAGRIIDQLELLKIVGPFLGSEPRKVRIKSHDELENYLQLVYNGLETYYFENQTEIGTLVRELENASLAETLNRKEIEIQREVEIQKLKLIELNQKKAIQQEAYRQIISEKLVARVIKDQNGNEIQLPEELVINVWQKDKGRCANCGSTDRIGVEPIILISEGGGITIKNLQLLCNTCSVIRTLDKI